MEIELRNERFSDYPETENVVREAFWNRYSPGCYEHYLIHIMRYSRRLYRSWILLPYSMIRSLGI